MITKQITGTIVQGNKKGRTLGFPTANIAIAPNSGVEPGIYAGYVVVNNKRYQAALYLAEPDMIEAFLFDFSADIYGKKADVEIVKKIRNKLEFKSDQEAITQITRDVEEIKTCLQELSQK